MAGKLFTLWIGLSLGLLAFALATDLPMKAVIERSFFQGFALAAAWFVLK